MEPATTSATSATFCRSSRRAFTLVELLVVIGIIVVIASIAIPMGMKAFRAADRARTQQDISSVALALEACKGDLGDYPRPDSPNTGFALLGRYLVGPGGVYTGPPPPSIPSAPLFNGSRTPAYGPGDVAAQGQNEYVWTNRTSPSAGPPGGDWVQFQYSDGHIGPGIKKPTGGRVIQPYVAADKFKMQGVALLDHHGNPILYFPAALGAPNIHATGGYATAAGHSMYNTSDNEIFFRAAGESDDTYSRAVIQMMLGDLNQNGMIDSGETEATTAPFILWAAGPDGIYGPARYANSLPIPSDLTKCDDPTNFR